MQLILRDTLTALVFLATFNCCLAAPEDAFVNAGASLEAPTEESAPDVNRGEWGVTEQRGIAAYTFRLTVPPGRSGMVPSVALRYSSRSPIVGTIAAGWSLDLPNIRIDRWVGRLATLGAQTFVADVGQASGRLYQIAEASPYGGKSYRIESDATFVRVFGVSNRTTGRWIALTIDGKKHYFAPEGGKSEGAVKWNIDRQVDPFGNEISYFWESAKSGEYVGHQLKAIEYGANAAAGLGTHTRIDFVYRPLSLCRGADLPIGAGAISPTRMEQPRALQQIRIFVRTKTGAFRLARSYDFEYTDSTSIGPSIGRPGMGPVRDCGQRPVRYLQSIRSQAVGETGAKIASPAISFAYNRRLPAARAAMLGCNPSSRCTEGAQGLAVAHAERGGVGGVQQGRFDIDGDSIPDSVRVSLRGGVCVLKWRKGLPDGTYAQAESAIDLPTSSWLDQQLSGDERCTLNGQVFARPGENRFSLRWGYRSYQFLDYDGDGLTELISVVNDPTDSSSSSTWHRYAIYSAGGTVRLMIAGDFQSKDRPPLLHESRGARSQARKRWRSLMNLRSRPFLRWSISTGTGRRIFWKPATTILEGRQTADYPSC